MNRFSMLGLFVLASMASAQDMPLSQVLIPGEGWKAVDVKAKGKSIAVRAIVADVDGHLLLAHDRAIWKVTKDGLEQVTTIQNSFVTEMCRGPEGNVYTIELNRGGAYGQSFALYRNRLALIEGVEHVAVSTNGDVYYTAKDRPTTNTIPHPSAIPLPPARTKYSLFRVGHAKPLLEDVGVIGAATFWRDGGTMVVGDREGDRLYTYRVNKDGSLDAKEAYYTLRTRDREPSGVQALILDADGRLYAGTREGVQVFDPTGRMNGVINAPTRKPVTAMAFAGPRRDLLYVVCDGKLFVRKTKVKGFVATAKKP